MIFQKDDELVLKLAAKNNMDMDRIVSAYLVADDCVLPLLHIFEGQTLRIPSSRKLNGMNLNNILFIEDDERRFFDYKKGQILTYKDEDYVVLNSEKKVLNHYYLPVKKDE